MRISDTEKRIICDVVSRYDPAARTFLFGSRCREDERGGDIDLLCLSHQIDRFARRKIKREILDQIGNQQLDFVVQASEDHPFAACIFEDKHVIELK
jgi:predicted nucleotidyltransferase